MDVCAFMRPVQSIAFAVALVAGLLAAPVLADELSDDSDDVSWVLALTLAEGADETFDALMAEMVAATKEEAGTKAYEWFRNGDAVHIYERYDTSADAGIHSQNFGANFAERFFAILTPTSMHIYGPMDAELRENFSALNAVFHDQVGGFSR